MAEALWASGRAADALARHEDALAAATDADDRYEQARALDGSAHALHATGRRAEARRRWRDALDLYTALGVPEATGVPGTAEPGVITAGRP